MLLVFALLMTFFSSASSIMLKGAATNLEETKTLYTEHHTIERNADGTNSKIETVYRAPDGKVIARMTTDFSKSSNLPEIIFNDLRFDSKQELKWAGDKKIMFRTTEAGNSPKENTFTHHNQMVAGQGFDNFIRLNFEKLQKQSLPLKFGVLSEMDFFTFNGRAKEQSNNDVARFGIRISNMFLRLFADELVVEYDVKTREILTYRGLSNLLSDDKKAQQVMIRYTRGGS